MMKKQVVGINISFLDVNTDEVKNLGFGSVKKCKTSVFFGSLYLVYDIIVCT